MRATQPCLEYNRTSDRQETPFSWLLLNSGFYELSRKFNTPNLDSYHWLRGTMYEIKFSFSFWNNCNWYDCFEPIFLFKNGDIYWHILSLYFLHTFRRNGISHFSFKFYIYLDIEFNVLIAYNCLSLQCQFSNYWLPHSLRCSKALLDVLRIFTASRVHTVFHTGTCHATMLIAVQTLTLHMNSSFIFWSQSYYPDELHCTLVFKFWFT